MAKKDIELEVEAIDTYVEHIKISKREHVKALLNHIIEDEQEHKEELEKQLADIDKPVDFKKKPVAEVKPKEEEKDTINNNIKHVTKQLTELEQLIDKKGLTFGMDVAKYRLDED